MKSLHLHLLCMAGLMAAAPVQAQKNIVNDELDPRTGTRLQVRSVFDPLPASGYAPMRIVATNGTARNARWGFAFHSQTEHYRLHNEHNSSFALDVPARSTQSAMFLVPLALGYGNHGSCSRSMRVEFSGTGFDTQPKFDHDNRNESFPAVALSETLAEFSISQLNKELESRMHSGSRYYGGSLTFGSRFDAADLPDSWLGFSGFDFILLSGTDWQKLKPAVQRALMEWVRLGGNLHVFLTSGLTASSLGLPEEQSTSLGQIKILTWDGKSLPASATVGRYWGGAMRISSLTSDHTVGTRWPLLTLLGLRSFASWQVIVFLVVFGLLVGPVNLFVLAPAGKRHKLFITTPLLSLGASVVMVILILVQDGTGGMGRRFVAIDLEPADAAAYVTQEQVSRTGVLLSAGFEMKQPALVEPLSMPDTPWVKLKDQSTGQPANLTQEGRARRGNFFQSRAEQGQVLRAAVSTRARLELKAGAAADAPPTLISALGFTVDELFYTDAAGAHWRLEKPLATGRSATLVQADDSSLRLWREAALKPAVDSLRSQLADACKARRSFFVARAHQAPDFTLDTLSSIRWVDDHVVVFGPVTQP
ncbi:hypothetical protein [Prosthecobacter sp.]|uniref:hypothetical protein n=1 Tax=Prosthecobacter sp. TaxID=1965333 RepID=UPI003783BA2A